TNGTFSIRAQSKLEKPLNWAVQSEDVNYGTEWITEDGTEKGITRIDHKGQELRAYLRLPAEQRPFSAELIFGFGTPAAAATQPTRASAARVFGASSERRPNSGDESYKVEYFPLPPEAEMLITGMDWLPDGRLALCTWLGDVYLVQNPT